MVNFTPAFKENFHMDIAAFENIFSKVEGILEPKNMSRPDVIPPKQKLAMVIE